VDGSASIASINNLTSDISITLGRGRKVWGWGEIAGYRRERGNNH
jgi:hypothetical protein